MRLYTGLAIILSLFLLTPSSFAQTDLVEALDRELIPLQSTEVISDFSDLERLKPIFKDKRIVALGEATHGTHEFFTTKHRMLKFLVEELGFKTFAIEADFAGTFVMNDYVVKGEGTVLEALDKMAIGVWFTEEFVEMVEWIRQYNLTQPDEDKVTFYGFDMQFAFNSAPALLGGANQLKQPLSANAIEGLTVIAQHRFGPMDKSSLPLLEVTVKELEAAEVVESDPEKLMIHQHFIRTILRCIELSKAKYMFDRDVIRDRYMADNADWIYRFADENKMVVWAHNLHIAKDVTKNNNLPMGYNLSQRFPNTYYAMGFGFNSGSFRAYHTGEKKYMECTVPEVKAKNSSDFVFAQCVADNFIIDLKSAAQASDAINEFVNKKLISRAIGARYDPKELEDGKGSNQQLIKVYDAIIFIDRTTASRPLVSGI